MPKVLSRAQVEAFERDGFVSPVRAISAPRARYYRQCLEEFEAGYPDHRLKLDQKAHMICPRPKEQMGAAEPAPWQRAVEIQASVLIRGASRPPRALAGMTSGRPPGGG